MPVRRERGGGLIYALCLRLKSKRMTLPCGIIAISPWTDLTCSGESYEINRDNDPSLTEELLNFYSGCYTGGVTPKDAPEVSPLFGDLTGSAAVADIRRRGRDTAGRLTQDAREAAGGRVLKPDAHSS